MMTRQLRRLAAVFLAVFMGRNILALEFARVGSLERSDASAGGGPQAAFRLGSSPALPDWRTSAPGDLKSRPACYHFGAVARGSLESARPGIKHQ
jgi:hypothetical protein